MPSHFQAGYAFRGNRRKYAEDESAVHDSLRVFGHPEMQTVAGAGADTSINLEQDVRDAKKAAKKRAKAGIFVSDGNVLDAAVRINANAPHDALTELEGGDDDMLDEGEVSLLAAPVLIRDEEGEAKTADDGDKKEKRPKAKSDHTRVPILKKTGKKVVKRGGGFAKAKRTHNKKK